jgi:hypothetical protein
MSSSRVTIVHRACRIAAAAALFLGLARGPADAAGEPGKDAPAADQGAAPAAPNLPAYEVEGFRSARFGMTEAEIRKAIAADFKVADKAITREVNAAEQTAILNVTVPDLLSEAGPAHISYVFGYSRHQLIYVNVLWNAPKKDGAATNALLGPAAALRSYFMAYSFRPEGLVRDATLSDGSLVLLQGADGKGRAVTLITGETAGPGATEHQWYLRLSYIENPGQPDIFRIKPGAF